MTVSTQIRELCTKVARQVQIAIGQRVEVFGQDEAATSGKILLFGPGEKISEVTPGETKAQRDAKDFLATVEPVDAKDRMSVLYMFANANAMRNTLNSTKKSRSAELAEKYQSLVD